MASQPDLSIVAPDAANGQKQTECPAKWPNELLRNATETRATLKPGCWAVGRVRRGHFQVEKYGWPGGLFR